MTTPTAAYDRPIDRSVGNWRAMVDDAERALSGLMAWNYSHDDWTALQQARNVLHRWQAEQNDRSDMTTTTFVPPLAQRLIERFELAEVPNSLEGRVLSLGADAFRPGFLSTMPGTNRPAHTSTAVRLWTGPAQEVDDGYDFAEVMVTEFGWPPNPDFGDWPMVMEWFRVHDPKDDPDESGRLFYWIRLTYIEKGLYVALYTSKADAAADARPIEEN
jgi:hypothetical protein